MQILNYGSLNYDYVFDVDHIVKLGETVQATTAQVFLGGKGLNQSVAMARAGSKVFHAGIVGADGQKLLELCDAEGIDRRFVSTVDDRTGNAIIQVNKNKNNAILVSAGANGQNTAEKMEEVFSHFQEGDYLLLQNEVNGLPQLIEYGRTKKMKIVLNPSPFNENILACDLRDVSCLIMNETEGRALSGKKYLMDIIGEIREKYPKVACVLTHGETGSAYFDTSCIMHFDAYRVDTCDTTAAGDTFTGYFLACLCKGLDKKEAVRYASAAAAIAASRRGAVPSIPALAEVESFLKNK